MSQLNPERTHHPVVVAHRSNRKADHDVVEQEQELKTNTDLTRDIHALATEIRRRVVTDQAGAEDDESPGPRNLSSEQVGDVPDGLDGE